MIQVHALKAGSMRLNLSLNSKQTYVEESNIEETIIKNEIITDSNNIREAVESNQPLQSNNEHTNNINEGLKDVELRESDTNNMLDKLMKQRDMDNSIHMGTNIKTDNKLENKQPQKIGQILNDNIIELDDDMTFKIKFNKPKKPKTILFKKILLLVDELDEAVLDIPYFIVTVGSNSRYFFNNGLNGNSCVFDAYLDFPIDIQREDSLTIEITNPTGDIYKQKNVLVYLNY